MVEFPIFVDLNLNKQSLVNAKFYALSTAARTALSLTGADAGLFVYDTTLFRLMIWTGTVWSDATPAIATGLYFKGSIAANATAPSAPTVGDLYVFSSAGTLGASWTPVATVAIGDQALWDGSTWQYIQGNTVSASISVEGTIQIATQAETDAGSVANKAITPANLANYVPPSALSLRPVRRYSTIIPSLSAGVPSTVTHSLALAAAAQCSVSTYQGGNKIILAVAVVDANSISITSNVTLSNVTVVVEG